MEKVCHPFVLLSRKLFFNIFFVIVQYNFCCIMEKLMHFNGRYQRKFWDSKIFMSCTSKKKKKKNFYTMSAKATQRNFLAAAELERKYLSVYSRQMLGHMKYGAHQPLPPRKRPKKKYIYILKLVLLSVERTNSFIMAAFFFFFKNFWTSNSYN